MREDKGNREKRMMGNLEAIIILPVAFDVMHEGRRRQPVLQPKGIDSKGLGGAGSGQGLGRGKVKEGT